jgi:folate-binding protein YgfZ
MQLDFVIDPNRVEALRSGSIFVSDQPALVQLEGPGAVECVQGLLTNDIVAAGEHSVSYGAMLTSKGMIMLDPFVLRAEGSLILVLPAEAREPALSHLGRTIPPRLAKVRDRTGEWEAAWILGEGSEAVLRRSGESLPKAGKVAPNLDGEDHWFLAKATREMPFACLAVGGKAPVGRIMDRLQKAGAVLGDEATLAAARVLAGWPTLGREIDEKTLPQEVRFDELSAVSYSKGCYTGQETVARVHFRGHPNRHLRAVTLTEGSIPADRKLFREAKEVGVLRTTVRMVDRTIGLATLRREVPEDATLQSGAVEVRLVPFPLRAEVPA